MQVLEVQVEQNVFTRNIISQLNNSNPELYSLFPVTSEDKLLKLEEAITDLNRQAVKKTIKSLLTPQGITKNLKYILSSEIVNAYNIDGVQGKTSRFKIFFSVLTDSIDVTTNSGTPDHQLRDAFRLQKKKDFLRTNALQKLKT
ncbi:hypothetical protein FF38_03512, partial [Lucilia cuprina]